LGYGLPEAKAVVDGFKKALGVEVVANQYTYNKFMSLIVEVKNGNFVVEKVSDSGYRLMVKREIKAGDF
jgi:hypothetical protein